MASFTLNDVREQTFKTRDSWWTVFLVDPLAARLVVWTANHTSITPNQLTFGAGVLGLASACCFALGDWPWLVAGAILFHLSFVLDCMDGKIARLKDTGSIFGVWVDFMFDRIRFFGCVMALLVGQWVHTGNEGYLLLAPVVTFVDMFRYLDGPQLAKTRRHMRGKLHEARAVNEAAPVHEETGAWPEESEPDVEHGAGQDGRTPEHPAEEPADRRPAEGAQRGILARVRGELHRRRVRLHLFSGIEFEMSVCVLAPLTSLITLVSALPSLITPVLIGACVGLLAFEVALIYRLWLATRQAERELSRSG